MAAIMSDPYFKRGSNLSDLKKVRKKVASKRVRGVCGVQDFWREMNSMSEMIPEHRLNVDEFQTRLQAAHPRAARLDQTIREAERVLADLGSTVAATRDVALTHFLSLLTELALGRDSSTCPNRSINIRWSGRIRLSCRWRQI